MTRPAQGSALQRAFARDGAIKLGGLFNEEILGRCREHYDWSLAHPGPYAFNIFDGTQHKTTNDNANPAAQPLYKALVSSSPFAEVLGDVLSQTWGSENVWYFAEEIFAKEGGVVGRSPWHQDTSYLPWTGTHWANLWITFESVPKENSLEIVRGSHLGPIYDGATFTDPTDPTKPLHGIAWPRLPDIEAERKTDATSWDVISWAVEPGDVIMLHPHCLHGGAPVSAEHPNRHTLVLRFFGDDARFRSLPEQSAAGYPATGILFHQDLMHLKDGDPFRAPVFQQIR